MKNVLDKIKIFFKNYGDIFLYFLTVFLIVVTLFKPGYIFLTDYTSGPMQNHGSGMWGLIHNFFLLVFSQASVQKIVVSLSFLSVLIGGKKIVENFIENKYIVFAMSLFTLFNPYVYERTGYGQFAVILAYGFLLLTVGYILKYILNFNKEGYKVIEKDGKLPNIMNKMGNNLNFILALVFTGVSISFSPHFMFFVGIFWIMFLAFAILNFKKIFRKGFIISIFVSIVLFSIINLNYVLSFVNKEDTYASSILKTGITHQDLLAFATSDISGLCIDKFSGDCGFSSFATIEKDTSGNETLKFNKNNRSFGALYNVISMSGFWGKDQYRFHDLTKDRFIFNLSFFIILGLAIYGYIKSKEYFKTRNAKFLSNFLLGSFIIATILAVGIRSEIFRNFNFFLFDHFPFYQGIREPQKWVSVLCTIYLVFLSIAVKEIIENYNFKKK